MSRIFTARPRFLTFAEAGIVDHVLSTHLQALELRGSAGEAELVRNLLREFVYFTSSESLEDLQSYLLATGWQSGQSSNGGRLQAFYMPAGDGGEPVCLVLPTSMTWRDAEYLVIRAMYLLAFLEDPDRVTAYDILQQVRRHRQAANQRDLQYSAQGASGQLSQTTTLAGAVELLQTLIATYGAMALFDLHLRQHRVVRIDRECINEVLLAQEQPAYLCVDLACPRVGTVIVESAPVQPAGAYPLHLGRRCALYPLTPPVGVEIAPDGLEQYGQALLDTLNFGSGDSAYVPEATWEFAEGERKRA